MSAWGAGGSGGAEGYTSIDFLSELFSFEKRGRADNIAPMTFRNGP